VLAEDAIKAAIRDFLKKNPNLSKTATTVDLEVK
jgi:hypothetical protein